MVFSSILFLFRFFPVAMLLYYLAPRRYKNLVLLLESLVFYSWGEVRYFPIMIASILVDYIASNGIQRHRQSQAACRGFLLLSVVFNLGMLGFFKYTNFILGNLSALFGLSLSALSLTLPLGISFYTFQTMSYTIDVYRGDARCQKNPLYVALYVALFPQLVAGPIERSKNLLRQLDKPASPSFDSLRDGFLLMLWGYFLKVVLADRIAVFVDTAYGDIETYTGVYLIVATVLFAVQIYCDFSGYSVIAMGAAKMLGISLMENFNAPYLSTSVSEFWRRWHISLSTWFRDYLYIPLGGNRRGKVRKYVNLLITFGVSGLWHGANWTYVVWGLLNGTYQMIGEVLRPFRKKVAGFLEIKEDSLSHKGLRMVTTFLLVDLSWVFFRANTVFEGLRIVKRMLTAKNHWVWFDGSLYECGLNESNFRFMIWGILLLLVVDICKYKGIRLREIMARQDYWAQCLCVITAVFGILLFGMWGAGYDAANFIYFQF